MTRDQAMLIVVGGLAVLCVILLVALATSRRTWRRALERVHADVADLQHRLDEAERTAARRPVTASSPVEFVITDLGRDMPHDLPEPVHLGGPAFADIVLKETVVKAASLVHGVRRGLAPAARHRIRFEMKQEMRRARKQRRADLKAAQRDLRARQRAALAEEAS